MCAILRDVPRLCGRSRVRVAVMLLFCTATLLVFVVAGTGLVLLGVMVFGVPARSLHSIRGYHYLARRLAM